jgi:hypothetical protein
MADSVGRPKRVYVVAELEANFRPSCHCEEIGGEGKDSNLRMVFTTTASKPTAALANSDLSVCLSWGNLIL